MRSVTLFVLAALAASGAPDPWAKVREIKSGAEVRIVRDKVSQPVIGTFDEAREESVLVVIRNRQVAIPRAEIQRIDVRPPGGRFKLQSETRTTDPDASRPPAGPPPAGARQGTSSTGNVAIGKPGFETVYRRPPAKK